MKKKNPLQELLISTSIDPGKEYEKPKIDKEYILSVIADLVSDFVYYDRKEDIELDVNGVKQAIDDGVIGIDEIVSEFKKNLIQSL